MRSNAVLFSHHFQSRITDVPRNSTCDIRRPYLFSSTTLTLNPIQSPTRITRITELLTCRESLLATCREPSLTMRPAQNPKIRPKRRGIYCSAVVYFSTRIVLFRSVSSFVLSWSVATNGVSSRLVASRLFRNRLFGYRLFYYRLQ